MATRKPSDPVERALRLFTILQLLAARRPGQRFGRADLALACECSVKTIGRELLILKSHIPLDYDPVAKTYGLPDKGWALTTSALNGSDVLILALARSVLADDAGPLAAQLQTTLDKITVGLPPALRQLLTEAAQTVRATGGPARDYSHAPVALMQRAAARQETVEMLYDSRNSNTCERRLVDPYLVERRDGRYWEVHARCYRDGTVKTFALDRVLESRLTGQKFIRGEWDESSKGVFGGIRGEDWVALAVRFDATVAPYARDRTWPFDATLTEKADGSVVLTGQVRGVKGVVRELLTWRRHAVVLGGPELRAAMAEEVRAMAAHYADPENTEKT
jgi:predicted DNA-binding transcriptional regulator YafY